MTTAVATQNQNRALSPQQQKFDTVKGLVMGMKDQLAMALGKTMTADRMIRIVLTEMLRNPKLMDCYWPSLAGAVLQSAQLGLEPGGVMGLAYLVPFNNNKAKRIDVQFIPGYKGLVKLARNSGEISTVDAHEVYEADDFEYAYGLEATLRHRPAKVKAAKDRGKVVFFYAYSKLKDGGFQFCVMSAEEVDWHRDQYSKSAQEGPWVDNWIEMGMKTVLRKLCKLLPASSQLQTAVALDEAAEYQLSQGLPSLVGVIEEDTDKLEEQAQAAQLQDLQAALDAKRAAANANGNVTPAQEPKDAEIVDPDTTTQETTEEPAEGSADIDNSLWADLNTLWQESHAVQFQACKKTFSIKHIKDLPAKDRVAFRNTMSDILKAHANAKN